MTGHRNITQAFTLVEVTLALAAAIIGIVALMGLIVVSHRAARTAADDTIVATIVQDIFTDLRRQPFTGGPGYNLAGAGTDTLYFDANGFDASSGPAGNQYYRLHLEYGPDYATGSLAIVRAVVVWPSASTAPANTNVFVTKVARMD
jgi:hypothetical protein